VTFRPPPPPRERSGRWNVPDEPRAERSLTFDRERGKLIPVSQLPPPPLPERPASLPPAPPLPRLTPSRPVSSVAPAFRAVLRAAAESLKHLHVILLAVVGIGGIVTGAVLWATSRASRTEVTTVETALTKEKAARLEAEEKLAKTLRAELAAHMHESGSWWDQQDDINRTVAKQLNRAKKQTPPPGVGPDAKLHGRTATLPSEKP